MEPNISYLDSSSTMLSIEEERRANKQVLLSNSKDKQEVPQLIFDEMCSKQPTPFNQNRFVILIMCTIYVSLTGSIYYGWPGLSNMLFKDGAYEWLCESDIDKQDNRYRCEAQDTAVQRLFQITMPSQYIMSAVAGTLVDNVGPRFTAVFGQLINLSAWLLLSFSCKEFNVYILSFVLIGLGADTGFIPTLQSSNLFPGYNGVVIAILGAANSLSFAVPTIMDFLASSFNIDFVYICYGYMLVVFLTLLYALFGIPIKSFKDIEHFYTHPDVLCSLQATLPYTHFDNKSIPTQDKNTSKMIVTNDLKGNKQAFNFPYKSYEHSIHSSIHKSFSNMAVNSQVHRCIDFPHSQQREAALHFTERGVDDLPSSNKDREGSYISESGGMNSRNLISGEEADISSARLGNKESKKTVYEEGIGVIDGIVGGEMKLGSMISNDSKKGNKENRNRILARSSLLDSRRELDIDHDLCSGNELDNSRIKNNVFTSALIENESDSNVLIIGEEEEEDNNNNNNINKKKRINIKRKIYNMMKSLYENIEYSRSEFISRRFMAISFYFCSTSLIISFYIASGEHLLTTHVNTFYGILTPFSFIPTILYGNLVDTIGPVKVMAINTCIGLISYITAIIPSNSSILPKYISAVCMTIYVSIYTSQLYFYVKDRFNDKHFGKLIGTASMCGGFFSLISVYLYDPLTKITFDSNYLYVSLIMILFSFFNFLSLYFMKGNSKFSQRTNSHTH